MIKQIKVCSRSMMERLADSNHYSSGFGSVWHLISIHGDSKRFLNRHTIEVLKKLGMKKWISQEFWDVTDVPALIEKLEMLYPNFILFKSEQAKEIVDFLKARQQENEESVLVCHCDAGISRSGAVATFACEFCGLDYKEFMDANPLISPNPTVLRILREVSGVDRKADFIEALKAVEKTV